MSQSRPPIADQDKLHEVITAYLDGELTGADALEVEERLAGDDQFREAVKSHQQTWEMLDELPCQEADKNFSDTTIEMVTVHAEEDLKVQQGGWIGQLLRQWMVVGISVLVACVFGFLAATGVAALLFQSGVITDTNNALLADLPVIENIDRYQLAQDIDFLRAFDKLPPGVVDEHIPKGGLDLESLFSESLEPRRDRIEHHMADAEKQDLEIKTDRFQSLKPQQQQQLRDMHENLAADPNRDKLAVAMDRFYEWYKQLSRIQRDELRLRTGLDRIAYVKQLRKSEEKRIAHQRVTKDVQTVVRWMEDYAAKHERILTVSPRTALSNVESLRRRQLFVRLWRRWQGQPVPSGPEITDEAFAKLRGKLSPELQAKIGKGANTNAQWKLLTEIIPVGIRDVLTASIQDRLPRDFIQKLPTAMLYLADAKINRDKLMKFFHENLTREERLRLQNLPPDEFRKKLQQLSLRHQMNMRPRPIPAVGVNAHRGTAREARPKSINKKPNAPLKITPRIHAGGLQTKKKPDAE